MTKEFECTREVVLPAHPDRVFEAVSTVAGVTAWLFPTPVPGPDEAVAWDPPHLFSVRMEQGEWFNALEYTIEGTEGGKAVLRYVHSGVFMDDWDTQYDAVQQHTDFYLHTLGQYLEYFDGRPATYIGDDPGGLQGPVRSSEADGFDRLHRALGVGPDVAVGRSVTLPVALPGPVDGIVDYAAPNFLGVRTANGLYRFFGRNAFGAPVGLSIHLYDLSDDPGAVRSAWAGWLETSLA